MTKKHLNSSGSAASCDECTGKHPFSDSQLESVLQSHAEWLDTRFEEGERARFFNADLCGRNFAGHRLTSALFEGACLLRADFRGAMLCGADLGKADLRSAILESADLEGAMVSGANLKGCVLRDANLRNATLENVKGLQSHQLGGALTSLARLPREVAGFDMLRIVKDASAYARKIFLVMLVGCAYTLLTISTTTDARLLTNSATSPLPIIQARVPIVGFYGWAPPILLGIYLYFQLSMQKIWERLVGLPAELPDGRTLHHAADPWLPLAFVQSHFTRLKDERTFLDYLQSWASIFLLWWAVPLTLFALWARYLRRHELEITLWQIGLLMTATALGIYCFGRAVRTLRGERLEAFSAWQSMAEWRRYARGAALTVLVGLLCAFVSAAAIQNWGFLDFVEPALLNANLNGAEVSIRPEHWTGDYREQVKLVVPAMLAGRNLRGMRANRAFLVGADLRRADLLGAELVSADLSGADLQQARGLSQAQLSSACANSPVLGLHEPFHQPGPCPLRSAVDLSRSDFTGQNLRRSFLRESNLQWAELSRVDLTEAELTNANLSWSNLRLASLFSARLTNAKLVGANLRGSLLTLANLSNARLDEASLVLADLSSANLHNAKLYGTDLRDARNITQEQLDSACVSSARVVLNLPPGLKQPPQC